MAIYRDKIGTISETATTQFFEDVLQGLSSLPKRLQSKYFYDAEGDKLFQQIMQCPEYYLTRCEMEIFTTKAATIASLFLEKLDNFDILELGAGDATKSTHLLDHLVKRGCDFTYYPIDISANVIQLLTEEMPQRIPGIKIKGLEGEYFEMITKAYEISHRRKVILFLGSNIGNFNSQQVKAFLQSLNHHLLPGDVVLIGFDLKKNPKQILAAYNDNAGVTKQFNLNLLTRINRELNGNFDVRQFDHYPTYDPVSGLCRSFLVSLKEQDVTLSDSVNISFKKNEVVYMELSRKYSVEEIHTLATNSGFNPIAHFYDSNKWFIDIVLERS